MESDLGNFKRFLRSDSDVDKDYYDGLKVKFAQGTDDAKRAFTKYVPNGSVADGNYMGTAHYNLSTKHIKMNYAEDAQGPCGRGATFFHEHGHLIDDAMGRVSNNQMFENLLNQDINTYRIAYGKAHKLGTYDKVDKAISQELMDSQKHSAVSDIIDGLTYGNIKGCGYHFPEYWRADTSRITGEAFAHMYEAQFDKKRYTEMKKYFPKAFDYFETLLKEGTK